MTVLDSSAVIGALLGQPCAVAVGAILRDPDDGIAAVSAITIGEAMDVLVRTHSLRVDACDRALELLFAGGLEVYPPDADTARLAGLLRARHWNGRDRAVSLADCVILATAMLHREPVATTDRALLAVARAEGHPVIALPDSTGRKPA